MSEADLMRQIQAILNHRESPCRVWRNSVGEGHFVRGNGRTEYVRYGLGVGSADLVGLVTGTGQFLGIEVKTAKGRLSKEQEAWLSTIRGFGGIAEVMRTCAEAEAFVRRLKSHG